jgi:hypothetical protein
VKAVLRQRAASSSAVLRTASPLASPELIIKAQATIAEIEKLMGPDFEDQVEKYIFDTYEK